MRTTTKAWTGAAAAGVLVLAAGAGIGPSTPSTGAQARAVALCADNEPGERLEFSGRVLDERGEPLEKASVIAYQTDASGVYTRPGTPGRNPRLRGVAVTDADGWFRFRTIRPGGYPGSDDPSHIHLHVDAAVHQHRYVTFWFEGDPRVTPEKRRAIDAETVIVTPRRSEGGVWSFQHDIRLSGS